MNSFTWEKIDGVEVGVQLIGDKVIKHPKLKASLQAQKLNAKLTRIANALVWSRIEPQYDKNGQFVCP